MRQVRRERKGRRNGRREKSRGWEGRGMGGSEGRIGRGMGAGSRGGEGRRQGGRNSLSSAAVGGGLVPPPLCIWVCVCVCVRVRPIHPCASPRVRVPGHVRVTAPGRRHGDPQESTVTP